LYIRSGVAPPSSSGPTSTGVSSTGAGVVAGGSANQSVSGPSSTPVPSASVTPSASGTSNEAASPPFSGSPPASSLAFPRTQVPLSAFTREVPTTGPITVNRQGQFPAVTLSFNLPPDASLGDAVQAVNQAKNEVGVPASIQGAFQGTAEAFEEALANEPILILAAIVTVYIVLGVLYESYIHPLTILSTLPSAGARCMTR